jgi:DNA-binding transcriptional regulator YhcF (GntR family)
MNGWIKLHRKLLDNPLSRQPKKCHLWMILLMLANHETKTKHWGGSTLTIKPGQVLTSRKELASVSGLDESFIQRTLAELERENMIEQQIYAKFRVVTIVLWQNYQSGEQQNECTRNEQQNARINEQQENAIKQHETGISSHSIKPCEQVNEQQNDTKVNTPREYKKKEYKYTHAFEQFWIAYPKKVGKQDAIKSFNKIKPDDSQLKAMIEAVNRQKLSQQWQKDDGQYVPNPATWLNGRRWEDEIGLISTPVNNPTANPPAVGAGPVPLSAKELQFMGAMG